MAFLIPLKILIPVAIAIIILIGIIWYLYHKNKKTYARIIEEKRRFLIHKQNIENLKNAPSKNNKQNLRRLNQIARNFFKAYFNLDHSLTYLELEKEFKNQNRPDYAKFCKSMSDAEYTGAKITPQDIAKLINYFHVLIKNYEISNQ